MEQLNKIKEQLNKIKEQLNKIKINEKTNEGDMKIYIEELEEKIYPLKKIYELILNNKKTISNFVGVVSNYNEKEDELNKEYKVDNVFNPVYILKEDKSFFNGTNKTKIDISFNEGSIESNLFLEILKKISNLNKKYKKAYIEDIREMNELKENIINEYIEILEYIFNKIEEIKENIENTKILKENKKLSKEEYVEYLKNKYEHEELPKKEKKEILKKIKQTLKEINKLKGDSWIQKVENNFYKYSKKLF